MPSSWLSQIDPTQAQRVADHGYRAKTQRGGRDHRVQQQAEEWIQNPGRNRHSERVIHERKEQVLLDIVHDRSAQPTRPHDASEITLHEGDAGTCDRVHAQNGFLAFARYCRVRNLERATGFEPATLSTTAWFHRGFIKD